MTALLSNFPSVFPFCITIALVECYNYTVQCCIQYYLVPPYSPPPPHTHTYTLVRLTLLRARFQWLPIERDFRCLIKLACPILLGARSRGLAMEKMICSIRLVRPLPTPWIVPTPLLLTVTVAVSASPPSTSRSEALSCPVRTMT